MEFPNINYEIHSCSFDLSKMDASGSTTDLDNFYLDIMGQRPRINKLYTQLTLCFPLPDDSQHLQSNIVYTLKQGIDRLSEEFPWVAGKVVNEQGTLKINPFERTLRLSVNDLRHNRPDLHWAALQQANFPFSMLDESTVAPCKTFMASAETALDLPVFLIQANFIRGGLLLTFNGQHGSMDMTGQAQVIHLLAKACRDESFTSAELLVGNMNRKNVVPLLNDHDQDLKLEQQVSKDMPNKGSQQASEQAPPPKLIWTYFAFSASSLGTLKSLAMENAPSGSFVSLDDSLSAFVWQSITRARLPRLGTGSTLNSTLSRAIDARRALFLPLTYPGMVSNATFLTSEVDAVVKQPLGSIAAQLRFVLEPASIKQSICALATLISRHEDADKVGFANTSVPELDVRLSSWAKERFYDLDFGFGFGIGKPEAVRRPRFAEGAREGLVYFLPKRLDGEIVVGICLREEDLERLKGDQQFAKFGTYIG